MTTDDLIAKKDVIELISQKMQLSPRHVGDRVIKRPDFPRPRRQTGRSSVYAKQDVEKWLGIE